MNRTDDKVQCAGECRAYFERGNLDDLGLCPPCGDSYYEDDEFVSDFGDDIDEDGFYFDL